MTIAESLSNFPDTLPAPLDAFHPLLVSVLSEMQAKPVITPSDWDLSRRLCIAGRNYAMIMVDAPITDRMIEYSDENSVAYDEIDIAVLDDLMDYQGAVVSIELMDIAALYEDLAFAVMTELSFNTRLNYSLSITETLVNYAVSGVAVRNIDYLNTDPLLIPKDIALSAMSTVITELSKWQH